MANYVRSYPLEKRTSTNWLMPLVANADAGDPRFAALKKVVDPSHAVPTDFLADAWSVIAHFLPFDRAAAELFIGCLHILPDITSSTRYYECKFSTFLGGESRKD